MSDRFLTAVLVGTLAAVALYVLRDRIPGPRVSRDRPFIASNDQRVLPSEVADTRFEVLSRPGAGGPQYFCAAAEYARKVLRAGMSDQLVTLSPEVPSSSSENHRGVVFELRSGSGAPAQKSGPVLDLSQPGQARSVAVALSLCR